MTLLEMARDLKHQADTEKSHHYTARVLGLLIAEVERLTVAPQPSGEGFEAWNATNPLPSTISWIKVGPLHVDDVKAILAEMVAQRRLAYAAGRGDGGAVGGATRWVTCPHGERFKVQCACEHIGHDGKKDCTETAMLCEKHAIQCKHGQDW